MLQKKWFLYLTEFFAGMAVMAVEIGASRLLAPYFSSSQIVWTIIIGTIMIAMALGNLWGGRSADRHPDPARLYARILVASVWIALIPVVGKYIIALIAMTTALVVRANYLIWAAFVACFVLFVFPLMLLGTTTPSLSRYVMRTTDDAGRTVGKMNALNTIGSIIGTFVPTFLTIPAVGTALTFVFFAAVLFVLAALFFLTSSRRRVVRCAVSLVLIAASGFLAPLTGFAFWENDIYEDESIYNYLQVTEDDEYVYLSTNVLIGVQSLKKKTPGLSRFYYEYALLAPYMTDTVAGGSDPSVLILGLGSGTYASVCMHYFPEAQIDGVEIDKKIVDLAYSHFDMPDSVRVQVEDGRAVLSPTNKESIVKDKKYDVILIDAYQDVTIPFQMSTVEFFTLVRDHLNEGGVMIVNLNMYSDKAGSINNYLCDTIKSVFCYVETLDCDNGNREVFAMQHDRADANLDASLPAISDGELAAFLSSVRSQRTALEGGDLILTDDKAPIELLGMRMVDELIFDELSYYQNIYREKGLRGLFDELTK
ncbi:MAG: fused MFS/spermidine synthase [Clostridia bacterium]|nr:fused MFS/spermidine synthase [Clostridia bacterium]